MVDSNPDRQPPDVSAPSLPEIDSPPTEDVIDGVPSKEKVVEDARTADEIVDAQPSVADLLGDR